MSIIFAEKSAPTTNAKMPPIIGCVTPKALRKVRDLPFRISNSGNRVSKLTTPPKQPNKEAIATFVKSAVNRSFVNKGEGFASRKGETVTTKSRRKGEEHFSRIRARTENFDSKKPAVQILLLPILPGGALGRRVLQHIHPESGHCRRVYEYTP